jgi:SAM-dependent methyltransferase
MGLLHYLDRPAALSIHREVALDNFTLQDTDLAFFSLIRATYLRIAPKKVLDYGAGRNCYAQDFNPEAHSFLIGDLRDLRFGGANVTAADVSSAVLSHPTSHRQVQIVPGEPLPFDDAEFDLIISDFVFEHLENPHEVAKELQRVLKNGGIIVARTPNKFGYVAIIASLVPNKMHSAVLGYIQPDRKDNDVFPTYYRLNTLSAVRKYFAFCSVFSISDHWEPQYFFGVKWLYQINRLIHAILPSKLGMTSIFVIKKNLSSV